MGSIRTTFISPFHTHSQGHRTFTAAATSLDLALSRLLRPLKKQSPTHDVLSF